MSNYTADTSKWLDKRFNATDDAGIYFAHQPIYGFRGGHSEEGLIPRYVITYQIMKALSTLRFTTLLDVGGAEGYKAALARSLFNAEVRSSDLSEEACKRAKEIYGIEGEAIDIHRLPYEDNSFDVVLCSETLEHVEDLATATKELIRVCRKAVIITVPHEPKEVVERNISEKIPHAHIHSLDLHSFDFAYPEVQRIRAEKMLSPYLLIPSLVVEGAPRGEVHSYPKLFLKAFNALTPLFRRLFGERSARALVYADKHLTKAFPNAYHGMIFTLIKDEGDVPEHPRDSSLSRIIDFKVPYHTLKH